MMVLRAAESGKQSPSLQRVNLLAKLPRNDSSFEFIFIQQ